MNAVAVREKIARGTLRCLHTETPNRALRILSRIAHLKASMAARGLVPTRVRIGVDHLRILCDAYGLPRHGRQMILGLRVELVHYVSIDVLTDDDSLHARRH
jgi:hypothetical protein